MVTYVPSPGPVVGGAGGRLPLSPLLRSWVAGWSTWVGSADPGSSSVSHACLGQLDDEGQEPPMTTTVAARPPGRSRPRRAVRQARRPPADAPWRARRGLRDPAGPVDGGRDPRTCPAHRPPARPGRRRGRRGGPRQHDPLSHVLRRDAFASPGGPAGRARSVRQHRAASGGTPSAGSARTGRPGCRATATQGSEFDGFMRAGEIADMLQANLRFLAPVRPGGVITGMVQGTSPAATSRSPS